MITQKLFEYKTEYGYIYTKREYEVNNNEEKPIGAMYECFSNNLCEEYYNFLSFNNGKNNVKFANITNEDGVIEINPYSKREISFYEFRYIVDEKYRNNINALEEVNLIVNKGIKKEIIDKELRKIFTKNEEIEKTTNNIPDDLETFYKVFGDLFEDKNPTR